MKRQHVLASMVMASLLLSMAAVGCRGGYGLGLVASSSAIVGSLAARVRHVGIVRDKLLPFSIAGTRRFQAEPVSDPLRRDNAPLETVLGAESELARAIASSAPSVLESSGSKVQTTEPTLEPTLAELAGQESSAAKSKDVGSNQAGEAQVEADLPSSEAFARELKSELDRDLSSLEEQPERVDEEERLREARIQQLLDLLAKAEEQAAAGVAPPLPQAPIADRATELERELVEPQVVPQKVEAPKDIVLRATATIPYQSVRSEQVELLNVQQLQPTVPARPGLPAVVQRPAVVGEAPRGWANQDWSRELVPDFSALGQAAPREVQFAPLPAVQQPAPSGQAVEAGVPVEAQPNVGRIMPELDTKPSTAARPIQKSGERR